MPSPPNPASQSSSSTSIDDPESYELSKRPRSLSAPSSADKHLPTSDADDDSDDDDDDGYELDDLEASSPTRGLLGTARSSSRRSHKRPSSSSLPLRICASCLSKSRLFARRSASIRHRLCQLGIVLVVAIVSLAIFTFIFNPSYTHDQYPDNYKAVTDAVRKGGGKNPDGFWRKPAPKKSAVSGRGNPQHLKVFVAANIVNAGLIAGPWGDAVMELLDLLGEENVFLSEY